MRKADYTEEQWDFENCSCVSVMVYPNAFRIEDGV